MKAIDKLHISTGHGEHFLTMADLQELVKRHERHDTVLRFNHEKSGVEYVVYELFRRDQMQNAPELKSIDPDSRWLLAEKDTDLKRYEDETLKEWHVRVDEHIHDHGYFVDDEGNAHWFLTAEGAKGGRKAPGYNTVDYGGRNYRLYRVEDDWSELDDDSEEVED